MARPPLRPGKTLISGASCAHWLQERTGIGSGISRLMAQPSEASIRYYIKVIHLKIGTKEIFGADRHAAREDLPGPKHRQVDSAAHPWRSRRAAGNLRARVDQRCNARLKKHRTSYKLFT